MVVAFAKFAEIVVCSIGSNSQNCECSSLATSVNLAGSARIGRKSWLGLNCSGNLVPDVL